ncbi:MAG TPA: HAMP domain-containing sensor histidine kinase, partial [Planctomycetia bacterium]|nr:HAMP domain-containing sensor histidine kinase [Planctomycetia bacterium]
MLLPVAAGLAALAAIGAWLAGRAAENAALARLGGQMSQVGNALAEASFPLSGPVLEQLKLFSGLEFWRRDPDGTVESTSPPATAAEENALRAAGTNGASTAVVGGVNFRIRRFETGIRGDRERGELFILYPEAKWRADVEAAGRQAFLWSGAAAAICGGLLSLAALRFSRRLANIRAHTQRIAGGDYSPMPTGAPRDELDDVAASVNDMCARLSQYHDSLRAGERLKLLDQVGGGLAHQLRNSAAGARLAVQLHLKEQPPEDDSALQVALRQLQLIEERLHGYLNLGRGGGAADTGTFAAGTTLAEAAAFFGPHARHHKIDFKIEPPEPDVEVAGNRARFLQVAITLIDNAIATCKNR